MDERNENELSQEELEHLEVELLPKREALSVIGPLPATPGSDAATDLPKIADAEIATSPESD
jgi:hypothetical protein